MGSKSDWETMQHAVKMLDELEVPYEKRIVSAHRTPDFLHEYAGGAAGRGIQVIIAGAAPRTCPGWPPRRRCCPCSEFRSVRAR